MGINLAKQLVELRFLIHNFAHHSEFKTLLEKLVAQYGELELILCIMPDKNAGYEFLKYYTETYFGIRTQFFMEDRARRARENVFTSLGLKINAKFRGSDIQLWKSPFDTDEVMIVGADVNHPPQMDRKDPKSIAAVVGSVDGRYVSRYIARFLHMQGRREKITEFGELVMDLVKNFEKMNGLRPKKIIIFRDGVGFDEFEMVIKEELDSLKKLFTTNYRPLVSLVLVVKRHSTRFFWNDLDVKFKQEKVSRNVPAGTVFDSQIVHPNYENFYMCTHYANHGTSKPKHFYVLHDENNLGVEEIEKLCYYMCYVSAHNTSPIPLVTPVHYADLAAYRSRMHYKINRQLNSDKDQPSTKSDFHNTMFFL
ncbi:argonaute 2-like protein [Tanacetum coccineum]